MRIAFRLPCLFLMIGLCLTACVTAGPDYQTPVLETPASWKRLDPAVADGRVEAPDQWWRKFNEPLLSALVEEALVSSPDLLSARARLRQARAHRAMAAAGYFPEVSVSGSAGRSRSSEAAGSGNTVERYAAGFDAGWELDVFGGVRRGVEAAAADLAATEAALEDVRVTLAAEVARYYIEINSLRIQRDLVRANLASQAETLQLTEWRAQAGLVSRQDVDQARGNYEQTRARLPMLEISLAEAEHGLDILLGRMPGALHDRLMATSGLPEPPTDIAVGIPAEALRRRPDVRAAERALAAETARVGVAQANRYPSFRLSGSIGLEALTFGDLSGGDAAAGSLLAGISAPIFKAGELRRQVEAQDAVREQARIAYEQTVRQALGEVENALVALAADRERTTALAAAAEAIRSAARLARQRYGSGLIDFSSVLETERSLLSVEESLTDARTDKLLSLIRLYKALGGGWSPPTEADQTPEERP